MKPPSFNQPRPEASFNEISEETRFGPWQWSFKSLRLGFPYRLKEITEAGFRGEYQQDRRSKHRPNMIWNQAGCCVLVLVLPLALWVYASNSERESF